MAFQPAPTQSLMKVKIDSVGSVRGLRRTAIEFPAVAAGAGFAATTIDVDATLDSSGDVTATRATTVTVHGPEPPSGNPSLAGSEPAVQATAICRSGCGPWVALRGARPDAGRGPRPGALLRRDASGHGHWRTGPCRASSRRPS